MNLHVLSQLWFLRKTQFTHITLMPFVQLMNSGMSVQVSLIYKAFSTLLTFEISQRFYVNFSMVKNLPELFKSFSTVLVKTAVCFAWKIIFRQACVPNICLRSIFSWNEQRISDCYYNLNGFIVLVDFIDERLVSKWSNILVK